jgi:hypothetical protein
MENWFLNTVMTGFYSAVEWPAVMLFLGMGVLFFLCPVAGYSVQSRGRIAAGMWLLVAKMGLGLLRVTLLTMAMLDRTGPRLDPMTSPSLTSIQTIFPVLEMALFLMAMIMFVLGLQTLTRRPEGAARTPSVMEP